MPVECTAGDELPSNRASREATARWRSACRGLCGGHASSLTRVTDNDWRESDTAADVRRRGTGPGGAASVGACVTLVDDVAGSGDLPCRTDVEIALLLVSRRHRYRGATGGRRAAVSTASRTTCAGTSSCARGSSDRRDRYFASAGARARLGDRDRSRGTRGRRHRTRRGRRPGRDPTQRVPARGGRRGAPGEPFSLQSVGHAPVLFRGYRRRTRAPGWTTRWPRGRSGRCAGGAGCGATRSPTASLALGPAVLRTTRPSRSADRPPRLGARGAETRLRGLFRGAAARAASAEPRLGPAGLRRERRLDGEWAQAPATP